MTGTLQPLDSGFKIVDPQTGLPTLYFIQWAQQRQIDISEGITAAKAKTIIAAFLADHPLVGGPGIALTPSGNVAVGVTISAQVQAILNQISTTRGVVLFKGVTDWQALAPGAAGQFLKTNGVGADPSWAAGGGGGGLPWYYNPPLASQFTATNQSDGGGANTLTDDSDVGLIVAPASYSGGGDRARRNTHAVPAGSWTWTVHAGVADVNTATDYSGTGLTLVDTVSGKVIHALFTSKDSISSNTSRIDYWNSNGSSYSSTPYRIQSNRGGYGWIQIQYVSGTTTLTFRISQDGKRWVDVLTVSATAFLTNVPNQMGLVFTGNNTTSPEAHWLAVDHYSIV